MLSSKCSLTCFYTHHRKLAEQRRCHIQLSDWKAFIIIKGLCRNWREAVRENKVHINTESWCKEWELGGVNNGQGEGAVSRTQTAWLHEECGGHTLISPSPHLLVYDCPCVIPPLEYDRIYLFLIQRTWKTREAANFVITSCKANAQFFSMLALKKQATMLWGALWRATWRGTSKKLRPSVWWLPRDQVLPTTL